MVTRRRQRVEILLEPEQHLVLAEIAAHDGQSLSDLVQAILAQYLEGRRQAADAQLHQNLAALAQNPPALKPPAPGASPAPADDLVALLHEKWAARGVQALDPDDAGI